MTYVVWLWQNTKHIRLNMLIRIVAGLGRVGFGLLMVWLCKRFIDVTIRTGTRASCSVPLSAVRSITT